MPFLRKKSAVPPDEMTEIPWLVRNSANSRRLVLSETLISAEEIFRLSKVLLKSQDKVDGYNTK